jgi:hypothetical protein
MHTWIPQTIFTKGPFAIRDIGLLRITSNVSGTWWFTRKEKEHPAFAWRLVSPHWHFSSSVWLRREGPQTSKHLGPRSVASAGSVRSAPQVSASRYVTVVELTRGRESNDATALQAQIVATSTSETGVRHLPTKSWSTTCGQFWMRSGFRGAGSMHSATLTQRSCLTQGPRPKSFRGNSAILMLAPRLRFTDMSWETRTGRRLRKYPRLWTLLDATR